MRWLFNYLRECFCKHKFSYTEAELITKHFDEWGVAVGNTKSLHVSATCNVCGYHKKYKKY